MKAKINHTFTTHFIRIIGNLIPFMFLFMADEGYYLLFGGLSLGLSFCFNYFYNKLLIYIYPYKLKEIPYFKVPEEKFEEKIELELEPIKSFTMANIMTDEFQDLFAKVKNYIKAIEEHKNLTGDDIVYLNKYIRILNQGINATYEKTIRTNEEDTLIVKMFQLIEEKFRERLVKVDKRIKNEIMMTEEEANQMLDSIWKDD